MEQLGPAVTGDEGAAATGDEGAAGGIPPWVECLLRVAAHWLATLLVTDHFGLYR